MNIGESREPSRAKGITDIVAESSQGQKKYKNKDKEQLLRCLDRQKTSLADSFLNDPADKAKQGLKRKDPPKDS